MSPIAENAQELPESLYVQIVQGMSRTIGLSLAACFHQPAQAMFAAWWLANPWIATAAAFAGLAGVVRCVALLRWRKARATVTREGRRSILGGCARWNEHSVFAWAWCRVGRHDGERRRRLGHGRGSFSRWLRVRSGDSCGHAALRRDGPPRGRYWTNLRGLLDPARCPARPARGDDRHPCPHHACECQGCHTKRLLRVWFCRGKPTGRHARIFSRAFRTVWRSRSDCGTPRRRACLSRCFFSTLMASKRSTTQAGTMLGTHLLEGNL